MGIGLTAFAAIPDKEEILRMKTNMGLMSDTIFDENSGEDESSVNFFQQMSDHSRTIAQILAGGNPGVANKMFHHLILTQKLISKKRSSGSEFNGFIENFVRTYLDTLPVEDMSSLIYWDPATLNQVDSQIIRDNYKMTCDHYKAIYRAMVTNPNSPYAQSDTSEPPMSEEEFLWAFSTVSARSLVFNNEHETEMTDPNAVSMIVPLFDMLNHSREPNCIVVPFHDKLSEQSFVTLKSLRPIAKDEQLTISYGNDLANTHLIQKYGFVTRDNPVKKVITNLPFYDFATITFEE